MIGTVLEGLGPSPFVRAALSANGSNGYLVLAKGILPGARVGQCWHGRREGLAAFHAGDLVSQAKRTALTTLASQG